MGEGKWDGLRKAAEAATPGAWMRSGIRQRVGDESCIRIVAGEQTIALLPIGSLQNDRYHSEALRDGGFIATANPAAVLELLNDLQSLQAENQELRREVDEAREIFTPDVVFSGGRDADQCHWCRRELVDTRLSPEEAHNTDCTYLLWLSRNKGTEHKTSEPSAQ